MELIPHRIAEKSWNDALRFSHTAWGFDSDSDFYSQRIRLLWEVVVLAVARRIKNPTCLCSVCLLNYYVTFQALYNFWHEVPMIFFGRIYTTA